MSTRPGFKITFTLWTNNQGDEGGIMLEARDRERLRKGILQLGYEIISERVEFFRYHKVHTSIGGDSAPLLLKDASDAD